MAETIVLTKAGPRLIDIYHDSPVRSILINGSGMLFEKLELLTNRSALEGGAVGFYEQVASGLTATIDCHTSRSLRRRSGWSPTGWAPS